MIARLLDRLLGHRCALGCGQRVYPADVGAHYHLDHAGDPAPNQTAERGRHA